ncbi:hypothetical protein ACORBL_004593 [Escherichia coli]|uniref:hypothetical protein n=1 Tax=Escherichia coli TaxID=562 RepID=UPI000AB375D4|nr:hypothetical protein [Escherichia coli]EHZ5666277.1 hypothetical protein [Escherichia coli]EIP7701702.1 hypothetical protein [Escherichia coli]EIY3314699.1 hypothetical protein [Escherichia coli]EJF6575897.1 hypothetical protein [Escherichia coli]
MWITIAPFVTVASDRPFRATNLSRNIDNVRALLAHLLYHVKVSLLSMLISFLV